MSDASPSRRPRAAQRIERAACGICGRVAPMTDADFCGDCGLLVHAECFGGYCDSCCHPRCVHCVSQSPDTLCPSCRANAQDAARSA